MQGKKTNTRTPSASSVKEEKKRRRKEGGGGEGTEAHHVPTTGRAYVNRYTEGNKRAGAYLMSKVEQEAM